MKRAFGDMKIFILVDEETIWLHEDWIWLDEESVWEHEDFIEKA